MLLAWAGSAVAAGLVLVLLVLLGWVVLGWCCWQIYRERIGPIAAASAALTIFIAQTVLLLSVAWGPDLVTVRLLLAVALGLTLGGFAILLTAARRMSAATRADSSTAEDGKR